MGDAIVRSQSRDHAGFVRALRNPVAWVWLFALGLACIAYHPAFFPPTVQALGVQSEEFFFEANEAAGAPVLILSLWLFYRRSHYLDLLRGPGSVALGGPLLVLSAALYVWGAYTGAHDLQIISLIALLAGIVLLLGGWAALRAFWLPILFLGFALPVPPVLLAAVIFPVQLATAAFAGWILNAIGFEAFVQGDQILRPENTFVVIETCSGIRTMVTLSMLTVLLIDLFERRGWHAAILIGLAPIVAFVTNGFRVVSLVLNPHSSIHSIHNLQGIAMLLVGLTAMYGIDLALERSLGSRPSEDLSRGDDGVERSTSEGAVPGGGAKALAVAFLLFAMTGFDRLGPSWTPSAVSAESPHELLTRVFGEDPRAPYPIDYNFIGSVHYLAQARHRVVIDGVPVAILLGVANEQNRAYSILTPRLAWPGTGYASIEEGFDEIVPGGPRAQRRVFRRGARSVLSYSWIEGRGSFLGEWFRQAAALDRSPFVRPSHMLAIRLSTPLGAGGTDVEAAEDRIRRAWLRLAPAIAGVADASRGHDHGESN